MLSVEENCFVAHCRLDWPLYSISFDHVLYLHYVASHLNSMQCFAVFCVIVLVVSILLSSIDLHYVIV